MHNNPVILTDPTGMKADTTGIYNLNGIHQFTINDKLPNEDHFLDDKSIKNLASTCCVNDNEEGQHARNMSTYFIGKNTRSQIKEKYKQSAADNGGAGEEHGFVLYLSGNSKELKLHDITGTNYRTNRSFSMGSALEYTKSPNITTIMTGHTHLHNFFPSDPEDRTPLYNNSFTGTFGANPFLIAHKNGINIYTSDQRKNDERIYRGRKGGTHPAINY